MSDLSTFGQYNKLADLLIEKVSKEDLAECARLLAMNVAHYQSKYGELTNRLIGILEKLPKRFTSTALGCIVVVI